MRINKEEALRAGKLTNKTKWTDEELKVIIKFEQLLLAFLTGKGPEWQLASSPLRAELDRFEQYVNWRSYEQKAINAATRKKKGHS